MTETIWSDKEASIFLIKFIILLALRLAKREAYRLHALLFQRGVDVPRVQLEFTFRCQEKELLEFWCIVQLVGKGERGHLAGLQFHGFGSVSPAVDAPAFQQMGDAVSKLPPISGKGRQAEFGARISKHAALAFKGKVELWYGQKTNNKEMIAAAVKDLGEVINSGLYDLVADMFVLERPAGDFCEEYLFEHNSAEDDGFPGNPQNDLRHMWTGWPDGIVAPNNIYTGWGWNAVSGDFGRFLEEHEGDVEKPRFKSTIHTYEQVLSMDYNEGVTPGVRSSGICHNEGYFTYRGIAFLEDFYDIPGFWKYSRTNAAMLRYAEVLLLYAEAQFLNDKDADGSGLEALNKVRRRAQIDEVSALTYQIIKDERRAELFYEQERFFDLVRWGDAPTVLKDKGKKLYKFYGYKPGTTEWNVEVINGPGNGWQDKYNLLPFPFEQISANPNLKQNPGW